MAGIRDEVLRSKLTLTLLRPPQTLALDPNASYEERAQMKQWQLDHFQHRKQVLLALDVPASDLTLWTGAELYALLSWAMDLLGRLAASGASGGPETGLLETLVCECVVAIQAPGDAPDVATKTAFFTTAIDALIQWLFPWDSVEHNAIGMFTAALSVRAAIFQRLLKLNFAHILTVGVFARIEALCERFGCDLPQLYTETGVTQLFLKQSGLPEALNMIRSHDCVALVQATSTALLQYQETLAVYASSMERRGRHPDQLLPLAVLIAMATSHRLTAKALFEGVIKSFAPATAIIMMKEDEITTMKDDVITALINKLLQVVQTERLIHFAMLITPDLQSKWLGDEFLVAVIQVMLHQMAPPSDASAFALLGHLLTTAIQTRLMSDQHQQPYEPADFALHVIASFQKEGIPVPESRVMPVVRAHVAALWRVMMQFAAIEKDREEIEEGEEQSDDDRLPRLFVAMRSLLMTSNLLAYSPSAKAQMLSLLLLCPTPAAMTAAKPGRVVPVLSKLLLENHAESSLMISCIEYICDHVKGLIDTPLHDITVHIMTTVTVPTLLLLARSWSGVALALKSCRLPVLNLLEYSVAKSPRLIAPVAQVLLWQLQQTLPDWSTLANESIHDDITRRTLHQIIVAIGWTFGRPGFEVATITLRSAMLEGCKSSALLPNILDDLLHMAGCEHIDHVMIETNQPIDTLLLPRELVSEATALTILNQTLDRTKRTNTDTVMINVQQEEEMSLLQQFVKGERNNNKRRKTGKLRNTGDDRTTPRQQCALELIDALCKNIEDYRVVASLLSQRTSPNQLFPNYADWLQLAPPKGPLSDRDIRIARYVDSHVTFLDLLQWLAMHSPSILWRDLGDVILSLMSSAIVAMNLQESNGTHREALLGDHVDQLLCIISSAKLLPQALIEIPLIALMLPRPSSASMLGIVWRYLMQWRCSVESSAIPPVADVDTINAIKQILRPHLSLLPNGLFATVWMRLSQ